MTDEQGVAFRTVIVDPDNYSSADIARALQSDGFQLNAAQIVHYRTMLREGKATL